MHEYKRGKKTFGVYCTTGEDPGAHEYHDRAQSLAPWFIESETNGYHDNVHLSLPRPIRLLCFILYHVKSRTTVGGDTSSRFVSGFEPICRAARQNMFLPLNNPTILNRAFCTLGMHERMPRKRFDWSSYVSRFTDRHALEAFYPQSFAWRHVFKSKSRRAESIAATFIDFNKLPRDSGSVPPFFPSRLWRHTTSFVIASLPFKTVTSFRAPCPGGRDRH